MSKREYITAAARCAREIQSFGDLWDWNGYRIMARLLEAYASEPMGATKAALVYGMGTGLGLQAGKILAREMGANFDFSA